ncbi:R body protein [Dyella dinghuensis]|uniref:R body protein n=1 Tax=Dyella dinghuensis TaxID=1920169 RepID=A0A432LXR8_9GAMM|nr:RebB family R body protein [Dyella dinghuensis]RUL67109.1 R body protein [Dyella dinghuensis]
MTDETTVNSQITDAVTQVNASVEGSSEALARAMANQIMAHAVSVAIQNAVAQQQHLYMLRNAVTTTAVRAILKSDPEQALRFANEALNGDDLAQTIEQLSALLNNKSAGETKPGT